MKRILKICVVVIILGGLIYFHSDYLLNNYYLSKTTIYAMGVEFKTIDKQFAKFDREYPCYKTKVVDLPKPIVLFGWDGLHSLTIDNTHHRYRNGLAGGRIISANISQSKNGFVYLWTEEGSKAFIKLYNGKVREKAQITNEPGELKFLINECE